MGVFYTDCSSKDELVNYICDMFNDVSIDYDNSKMIKSKYNNKDVLVLVLSNDINTIARYHQIEKIDGEWGYKPLAELEYNKGDDVEWLDY